MSAPQTATTPEIKVEKGVPVPPHGAGRNAIYPWHSMEVGDSFWIKGGRAEQVRVGASAAAQRSGGRKWITRRVDGGVRVWRVA